jgi:hypothetical protein
LRRNYTRHFPLRKLSTHTGRVFQFSFFGTSFIENGYSMDPKHRRLGDLHKDSKTRSHEGKTLLALCLAFVSLCPTHSLCASAPLCFLRTERPAPSPLHFGCTLSSRTPRPHLLREQRPRIKLSY